jgi:CRP-like cAMP-binding protein
MTQFTSAHANIPMFSQLNDEELQILFESAIYRSYPKNRVLINEGDLSDSQYVINFWLFASLSW